jgi:hypothetical protein
MFRAGSHGLNRGKRDHRLELEMIEWFDDLRVGMCFRSPEKLVTRDEIKRFAAEFDPQLTTSTKWPQRDRH